MAPPPTLDPIFHQPMRTRLTLLLSLKPHSFSELKTALDVTDGNLDAHLRKLSSAGYLHSQMVTHNARTHARPYTLYSLSKSGAAGFKAYVKNIRKLLKMTDKP